MKNHFKRAISGLLAIYMVFGLFVISDGTICFAVSSALKNISSVSAESFVKNDTVSINCKASGGTGYYQYAAYYKKTAESKWTALQKYSANATIKFIPSEATDYNVMAKVKDSSGVEIKKLFVLKYKNEFVNTSSIDKTTVQLGDSVNITASASGGKENCTYSVYYKYNNNVWKARQSYSSKSKLTIKTTEVGSLEICVKAKDSSDNVVKKYFKVKIEKAVKLQNTSAISASSIKLGNSVKVTCSAKGNSSTYNYAVYYKKEKDSKWVTKQDFSPNTSVSIKPKYSTIYDIYVKAKDDKGNIEKKFFKLAVTSETSPNKHKYNITYYITNNDNYLKNIEINNSNPDFYYSENGLLLHDLIVDGYEFEGWYTAQTGGTQVTEVPKGTSGDKFLYAHWKKVEYTISFDSPDVPVSSVNYTVDKGITLTNPSCFGYTFIGWSKDGKLISTIPKGTTGNITLHANWTSNRNRAKAVNKLSDPAVVEDMDNGIILFVYNVGVIENIPLSQIEYIGNSQGINIDREYEYSTTINRNYAQNIAKSISNATVKSSEWTLSNDWNKTTSATNETEEEVGKTHTKTDGKTTTAENRYYISNGSSGSASSSTTEGNSSAYSSKVTDSHSTGINNSYTNEHSKETSVKLSNDIRTLSAASDEYSDTHNENNETTNENLNQLSESTTESKESHWNINTESSIKNKLSAGLSVKIPELFDVNIGSESEFGFKLGGEYGKKKGSEKTESSSVGWDTLVKSASSDEHSHKQYSLNQTEQNHSSESGNIERDVYSSTVSNSRSDTITNELDDTKEVHFDVSRTSESSWNTDKSYEISASVSRNAELSDTISQIISNKYSYSSSNSVGGNSSVITSTGENQEQKNEYASTVQYGIANSQTVKKTISFRSSEPGYYRLVNAGTAYVFAVVGYDIATGSYFTYTYNILDKETHEYLDYSKDNANFTDCENAVLPFEVPYFVNEYISSVIGRSDGLTVDTDTGTVTEYTGDAEYVVVPQYVSVSNYNNTYSAVRIRNFDKNVFKGNTKIKGVFLSKYISEIPDNAFEGCTSLEKVVAPGISKIGKEAFKGCKSLLPFTVDKYIDSLGVNAFRNVCAVQINAKNETVADAAISSGARILLLNLSDMTGSFSNRIIETDPDTEYFILISNDKTYQDLRIKSKARVTLLSNLNFANNKDIPLRMDSEAVILSRVQVQNSPGFAMVLGNPDTEVYLFGTVNLSSIGQNTVLSRNVKLLKANNDVAGILKVKGNYLICGSLEESQRLTITNGVMKTISEEDFNNMLKSFLVTFNANGGSIGTTTKYVTYGQTYGELPVPYKNNYDFEKWCKSDGTQVTKNTVVTNSSPHNLIAYFTPKKATVTFNANGGSVSISNKVVTFNSQYGDLPWPTKANFDFDGWYTAASGGTKVVNTTTVNRSDAHSLYAHWLPKKSTVYFNANGGSVSISNKVVTFNSQYGDLPWPTKANFDFDGWYTAASGGTKVINTTTVNRSDNHTLYAHWIAKKSSVYFNANGGNVSISNKVITFNSQYGDLPWPTKANFDFDGWYTAASGGTKVINTTTVNRSDNHTLYAHWIAKKSSVYFNANGGSVSVSNKVVTFNSQYGDLPCPTKANFDFDGWYTAASGGTKVINTTTVNRSDNHTLYARWSPKSCVVSFNSNGGSISFGNKTVQYGSKYGELPTAKKDYCNFVGWFDGNGTKFNADSIVNLSSNHTLYARFDAKPVSGWTRADSLPSGAQVTNRKWTYTLKTLKDSRNTSENGYKLASSEWKWCGNGSQNYASFPDGFDQSNWYYQNWNRQPFGAYENATSKRVVSNTWAGYIYWHWMFNCGSANAYDRAIHKRKGYDDTGCYYYQYFGAFDSRESYTVMGYNLYCNRCGMTTYYNTGRTSYADSQGSKYWFRFDYYTSKYDDYYKLFHYYREDSKESTSKPTASATIYNIVEWVQYRAK